MGDLGRRLEGIANFVSSVCSWSVIVSLLPQLRVPFSCLLIGQPTFYAAGNPFIEDQAGPIISTDGVHFSGMPINAPGPYPYPTQITYVPSADQYVMIIANGHVVITSSDGFKKQTNYTIPKTDNSHPVAESICTGNPPAIVVPTSRLSGTTAMTLISTDHGKKWQLVQDEQPSAPLEAYDSKHVYFLDMLFTIGSMFRYVRSPYCSSSTSRFSASYDGSSKVFPDVRMATESTSV